jgi:hypothetical protein
MKIKQTLLKYWNSIKSFRFERKWDRKNKIITSIGIIVIGYFWGYYYDSTVLLGWSIVIVLGIFLIPILIRKMKEETPSKKADVVSNTNQPQQNNVILCPKCGSNNIFISKRGFNASDACCGALLVGPLGLLCGQSGANTIEKTCLNCNKKF